MNSAFLNSICFKFFIYLTWQVIYVTHKKYISIIKRFSVKKMPLQ